MKMKYVMLEKGVVNLDTQLITCPYCDAADILGEDGKPQSFLYHTENCLFVAACRDLKVSPSNYDDKRVLRNYVIKNLFDPDEIDGKHLLNQ